MRSIKRFFRKQWENIDDEGAIVMLLFYAMVFSVSFAACGLFAHLFF